MPPASAPDVWELKLLLGQTFAHRWNWAANLTYEHENGGARERVFEMSSALTYALIDQTLNVGVEALFERASEAGSRSDSAYEFLIGPSINVRPTRNIFITVSPQFRITDDSPDARVFVIAGFNFSFGGAARPERSRRSCARVNVWPLNIVRRCRAHHVIRPELSAQLFRRASLRFQHNSGCVTAIRR
jgi:hypothetical protein